MVTSKHFCPLAIIGDRLGDPVPGFDAAHQAGSCTTISAPEVLGSDRAVLSIASLSGIAGEPCWQLTRHTGMTITIKFTSEELELLTALASDQLFRRQFIDPRLPGYKSNPAEIKLGKDLVERLRQMSDRAKGVTVSKRTAATV